MDSSKKYICIHGHFYQPPRENAWLETVEQQPSARPWHDWNERISFECYAPNASARILDGAGWINKIRNNYNRISFNFGPTLLSWMEQNDPDAYKMLLLADIRSMEKFGGHGSAMAQVHSHLIMPLCSLRDKVTQVFWGVQDFKSRFGRHPEGIWLAETAVNLETLEVVAEHGIQFTVLAPRQAKAIRKINSKGDWTSVNDSTLDTRRPFWVNLPSGRRIAVFFYNGSVSQAIAFEGALNSGKGFAARLLQNFSKNDAPEIVQIATDGESYGHHHRFGEMALVDCLNFVEEQELANLTNYGQFLALFPPEFEAEIHENSSWSCVHGIERWRSNCGCNSGGHSMHQLWRGPLRDALDWLRDRLAPVFEAEAGRFLKDVWAARNDYIDVILDREDASVARFLKKHARRQLSPKEEVQVLRLLEMQRNCLLMYTSCGWFFDEISGIETVQIMQYACRAMDYAAQTAGLNLQNDFLKRLAEAPSNIDANGADTFQKRVLPSRVDLERVGTHFAATYLFSDRRPEEIELFNFQAKPETLQKIDSGGHRLALGRMAVRSKITHSEKLFSFAVLWLGQNHVIGHISTEMAAETFEKMRLEAVAAFQSANLGAALATFSTFFGKERFSLDSLFRDEKAAILRQLTETSRRQTEAAFRQIFVENYQLMTSALEAELPVQAEFQAAARFVLMADLERFFEKNRLEPAELSRISGELKRWKIPIAENADFLLTASERIFREFQKLERSDASLEQAQILIAVLEILAEMNAQPNVWKSQNVFYFFVKPYKKGQLVFVSADWERAVRRLGELLRVRV